MAGLRIPHNTMVLVGDAEKALFFRNKGDDEYIDLVVEHVIEAEDRENDRGEPGQRDADAVEETAPDAQFTQAVSKALYQRAHAGEFDRLIVAAPPKVLGLLRKELHKEVSDRLIAEVPKTLTGRDVGDIQRVLAGR